MADAPQPANPFGPFDVSDFTPGGSIKRPHAPLAMVREVAEAPSRAALRRPRGRRKTGRTEQLNLRVRAEDLARFVEISDEFGWVFGETLQHLVEAFDKARPAPLGP